MSDFILFIHSWIRWIILILGLVLIIKGFAGMSGNKVFNRSTNTQSGIFTGLFHLQVLLGLIMYFFLSDITTAAFSNFGGAMKNSDVRFWAVEHIFTGLLAAVFVQIGRTRIKKADSDRKKYKAMAIFFLIGLLLAMSRIPWGVSERLFRGF